MMHKAVALSIVLLLGSLCTGIGTGGEMEPIRDFQAVVKFPESMVTGSIYEAHFRFMNIASKEIPLSLRFIVDGPNIGMQEWFVNIIIDGEEVKCYEVEPGVFNSSEYLVSEKEWHELRIKISSLPNILPATYNLTLELYSTKLEVPIEVIPMPPPTPSPRGWRFLPTPTPTPVMLTPTEITPTHTPAPAELPPIPMPTPTPRIPGFETIYVVIGLTSIYHVLRRMRFG